MYGLIGVLAFWGIYDYHVGFGRDGFPSSFTLTVPLEGLRMPFLSLELSVKAEHVAVPQNKVHTTLGPDAQTGVSIFKL